MRRALTLLPPLAGAVLLLAAGWARTEDKEPVDKDPTLSEWVGLLKNKDRDTRRTAAKALGAIGPAARAAVPALIDALRDDDVEVCWLAAKALGAIGPEARGAVEALTRVWKDDYHEEVRFDAAVALGRIRGWDADGAVTAVAEFLSSPFAFRRREAALVLADLGPAAKAAAPALRGTLQDRDAGARSAAALALVRWGLLPDDALRVLVVDLDDSEESVRTRSRDVLAAAGAPAIRVLVNALNGTSDPTQRGRYLNILRAAATQVGEGVPALLASFKGMDPGLKSQIVQLIWAAGEAAVPGLTAALKSSDPWVRREAATELAWIGPRAKAACSALADATKDDDASVRAAAASGLAAVMGGTLAPVEEGAVAASFTGPGATDESLQWLKTFQGVRSLDLTAACVTDAALKELKDFKDLESLNLSATAVTGDGLKGLKDLPALRSLTLDGDMLTDATLRALRQAGLLHVLSRARAADGGRPSGPLDVRTLNLSHTQATDAGLEELRELKGLRSLDLTGTAVTGSGLKALKELDGIQKLNLALTDVTDEGLAGLKDLKGLRTLNLTGADVTDAGINVLKDLPNLQTVYLRDTRATAAGRKALQAASPRLQLDP